MEAKRRFKEAPYRTDELDEVRRERIALKRGRDVPGRSFRPGLPAVVPWLHAAWCGSFLRSSPAAVRQVLSLLSDSKAL